jgi:hypothetical protein
MLHRILLQLFLASLLPLSAQTVLGTITGRVTDPAGASVPNAAITATNTGTNLTYRATTGDAGNYVIQQLPVGTYEVSVEATGFRRNVRRNIELNVAQTLALDVALQIGEVEQTVEVTADVSMLQTATSDLGTTINRSKLVDLPLFVGGGVRNLEQFIFLAPGVTGDTGNTQISGSPSRAKEVLVDGIASTGVESGGVIPGSTRPSVETIAEFRLLRGGFNAEYGRTGGGVQIFVTRSGTNDLHGSLFDYLRNEKLDARGFFQARRPVNKQNEFGAVLGGPVVIPGLYNGRNKTFFFAVYSGFRFRQGAPNTLQSIIPEDFRRGDFSRLAVQLYDPATTRLVNGQLVRDPFPGNQIPLNRFSTVSRNVLAQIPTPTSNGLFNNFTSVGRGAVNENQGNLKVDHQFTESNRMSVYFYRDILEGQDPVLLPGPTSPNRASGSRNVWGRVTHDYIFSPSLLNHLTLGYTRFLTSIENYSVDQNWPTQLGLTGVNTGPDNYFPCIDFIASGYRSLGDQNCNGRVKQTNNNIQVLENVSWVRGSHNVKVGLDYRWMETNGIDNFRSAGIFQFNALETGLPGNPNSGNALASFLLGTVNRGQQAVYGYFPRNRYQYMALYAQDDWKATNRLTLNYGLRYDVFFPRYEKNGNLSNLDPNLPNPGAGGRPGALEFLGEGPGRTGRTSFSDTYWKNFAPRLGLAYQIAPRTVLRSAYGIYYALGNANAGLRDSIQMSNGWITNAVFASTDAGVTPAFNWDGGFPQNFVRPPVIEPAAANGNDLRVVGREDGRPPYFQNWSFTVEQEIVPRVNIEVSYLGTKGSRLGNGLVRLNEVDPRYLSLGSLLTQNINSAAAREANIPIPYAGFNGSVAQALRPFPQYQEILRRSDPSGSSTYHALQTQFTIRNWKGLDVQSAYTWAKTISDSDILAGGGPGGQTTYNRRLEKAIATTDVPHVFALAYSYELPFGRGRHWMNVGGVTNAVLGGWVITGIHQYSVGTPLQLTANNSLPLFNAVLRPNVVAGQERRNNVDNFDPARDLWINPAAFTVPSAFQFGTAARSYTDLRNPNFLNENFGLLKRFALTETARLTFRAEFFNAFNRVVFGGIQTNRSNAAFGRVTSQTNTPRQGQLALRLDF